MEINLKFSNLLIPVFMCFIFFLPLTLNAQIKTTWLDTTVHAHTNTALFFTNRKMKPKKKMADFEFKNKSSKQTNNMFFCLYDYDHDTILRKYRAQNISDNYPTQKIEENIFYKIYEDLRIKKGVKKFSLVVPGYSHTFKEQVTTFMKRVKVNYTDSIEHKAVILYAWGDEWRPYRYYKAKKSAKNGANDFAIFQHMLEDFITDSVYFASHPKDFTIYLTCTSMGNQLLKEYLLERERQGIPLMKVYKSIMLLGSDASWDSFEPEKGFHNIGEMCDTARVVYHGKDVPLKMSTVFNLRRRMGLHGPRDPQNLPDYVRTYDIGYLLTKGDKSGLYHDYLLSNTEFQKLLRDGLKEDD